MVSHNDKQQAGEQKEQEELPQQPLSLPNFEVEITGEGVEGADLQAVSFKRMLLDLNVALDSTWTETLETHGESLLWS